MEPEPLQDKNVDEVLDEIDWAKLGVEGVEEEAVLPVPAQTEPSHPARIQVPPLPQMLPPPPAPIRPLAPAPAGLPLPADRQPPPPALITLSHRGSEIEIIWKWFDWQTLRLTAIAAAFDVVLLFLFFPSLQPGTMMEVNPLYPLPFVPVAVCLTYYTIGCWLNRTRIVVSRDKFSLRHGPLPWLGNKEMEASYLKEVDSVDKETYDRRGNRIVTYEVRALTGDGRSVKLLGGHGLTREQSLFIALQIEIYLGIRAPVSE